MTETQVIDLMRSATSEKDWNSKCDEVKKVCNGYPEFWYRAIIMSGLLSEVSETWKK